MDKIFTLACFVNGRATLACSFLLLVTTRQSALTLYSYATRRDIINHRLNAHGHSSLDKEVLVAHWVRDTVKGR